MKITVIGPGRWGSFISWYLDSIGHSVTLYGRESSRHMQGFLKDRKNDILTLPESVAFSTELASVTESEVIVISVDSQGLRALMEELSMFSLQNKTFLLCMKGIEIKTGKRLSEVAKEYVASTSSVAVWLGPGHVQEFYGGVPNCMVIDCECEKTKARLVEAFSSDLIRLYYGEDLVGNEIGAAAKNVIGIAAGILDGLSLSSLKGALMARGAREIARLIRAMGGKELSAYGLCHLGDYEATVFSRFSHNRAFGECFAKGERYSALAEGYYTVAALERLSVKYGVELPICHAVYEVLYCGKSIEQSIGSLFQRSLKREFYCE